jgi:hypothetical protein
MSTTNRTTNERRLCQPGQASDNVVLDVELDGLMVPLTPAEEAAYLARLDSEGERHPIIVWQGRDIVVEGQREVRHARSRASAFWVVDTPFPDRPAVAFHIFTQQLGRALSRLTLSYLRGKRYELLPKSQGARTDLTSSNNCTKSGPMP